MNLPVAANQDRALESLPPATVNILTNAITTFLYGLFGDYLDGPPIEDENFDGLLQVFIDYAIDEQPELGKCVAKNAHHVPTFNRLPDNVQSTIMDTLAEYASGMYSDKYPDPPVTPHTDVFVEGLAKYAVTEFTFLKLPLALDPE